MQVIVMGVLWLLLGLGLVPWHCSLNRWGVEGHLSQSGRTSQVIAMAVLGLNGIPWSERSLPMGVDCQLFGGGESSFGYTDLISPRVDSDISDYYYDYQDQVCKFLSWSFSHQKLRSFICPTKEWNLHSVRKTLQKDHDISCQDCVSQQISKFA